MAHLLHHCGSWKEGWSESHPKQLTVNSGLKQGMESFSKLWPFGEPSLHGKYCPASSRPSKVFAVGQPSDLWFSLFLVSDLRMKILKSLAGPLKGKPILEPPGAMRRAPVDFLPHSLCILLTLTFPALTH